MSEKYGKDATVLWSDRKRILGMPISFTKYTLATDNEDWTKLFIKTGILSTNITITHSEKHFDNIKI